MRSLCPALLFCSLASALVAAPTPDLLVVGAGISGLSAAAEGARLGLRVTVVDRNSVYGGTAVVAYGIAIVGSPLQEQLGIKDSPELAYQDFVSWGGDPHPGWARYYAEQSKTELFDWFSARGVQFEKVVKPNGNSVARFHHPRGGDVALVAALYQEILRFGKIEFVMNTDVTGLVRQDGRVTGVNVQDYRSGKSRTISARNVLLSTGGFQNSPELVRNYWPSQLGRPERILLGGGFEATGSGLALARAAGGAVAHLDRQWNYSPGIPLPDGPEGTRGVYVNIVGPIWVNAQGRRFINESGDKRARLEALAHQTPAKAWMIFDASLRSIFEITHPVFNSEPTRTNRLNQPGMMIAAATIEELGEKAGLPPAALAAAVERYNLGIQTGKDEFGRRVASGSSNLSSPELVQKAPFFAVPVFPLTRKSMGGIQVDMACRVQTESGQAVPGLYAGGEATGFGGLNGKQSLEGTFIGGAILMGRVAARSVADATKPAPRPVQGKPFPERIVLRKPDPSRDASCQECHDLGDLTNDSRPGYRHFRLSHGIVLERKMSCSECHAELAPYRKRQHRIDKLAQTQNCVACHGPGH